ncbi:MAG: signal peptidase I [Patescibacteria group bacterium]
MQDLIEEGNFNEEEANRGWRVGHFIKDRPNFTTDLAEFQWNFDIKEGSSKGKVAYNKKSSTLTILVEGEMVVDFPHEGKSITLSKEGDYAFFAAGVCHTWRTTKPTKMVGVRWPSIEGDQMDCDHQ